jgi:hypothetical protein
MNKIIFQLGLLGFFVSCVLFGLQGFSLFDAIGRAFLVFIAVIFGGAILLAMISWISSMSHHTTRLSEEEIAANSTEHSKG